MAGRDRSGRGNKGIQRGGSEQVKKSELVRGTHSLETVDVRTGQNTESKQASKGTTEEVGGRSGQDTERNQKKLAYLLAHARVAAKT